MLEQSGWFPANFRTHFSGDHVLGRTFFCFLDKETSLSSCATIYTFSFCLSSGFS